MVAFSGYPNHVVALSGITITDSSVSHELVDNMYYNVQDSDNEKVIIRFCVDLLVSRDLSRRVIGERVGARARDWLESLACPAS